MVLGTGEIKETVRDVKRLEKRFEKVQENVWNRDWSEAEDSLSALKHKILDFKYDKTISQDTYDKVSKELENLMESIKGEDYDSSVDDFDWLYVLFNKEAEPEITKYLRSPKLVKFGRTLKRRAKQKLGEVR